MRRILLSAFFAWHLVAVVAWVTPGEPSPFRARVLRLAQPYLAYTGLWQFWDMFAPKPLALVAVVEAVITFDDGTQTTWRVPGPEIARFGKFRFERWRKWREAIRLDANRTIWPDTARFAARLHANGERRPVKVDLVRRWVEISPPTADDYQPRVFPEMIHRYLYFSYDVPPSDLSS